MIRYAPKTRRTRQIAFTLIELLVVIAIIALLIAILLPSLEAARAQSKKAACLSHIKNVATSSRVYEADDPSGWGIPVHPEQFNQCPEQARGTICADPVFVGAYEWGGKSGIGRDFYLTGSSGNPLDSKYGSRAGFGPATRPMNDILYPGGFRSAFGPRGYDRIQGRRDTELDLGLFRCPGDNGPPRGAHCPDWINHSERSSYDHFGNSYAANVFMIGPGGPNGDQMVSNSPYMRPTSRIPTPARTLYYEENIGRWAWSAISELDECLWIGPGIDPGFTKTITGWHKKDWTFNRAFVDAHAESQIIYNQGTENSEGYATHYRNEVIYPENPGLQRQYQCIIVRGDGWQKDTLPADFVDTDLIFGSGNRPSYEDCVGTGAVQPPSGP